MSLPLPPACASRCKLSAPTAQHRAVMAVDGCRLLLTLCNCKPQIQRRLLEVALVVMSSHRNRTITKAVGINLHCVSALFPLFIFDSQSGRFHSLAVVNSAAVTMRIYRGVCCPEFSGYVPRSDRAGSYDTSSF